MGQGVGVGVLDAQTGRPESGSPVPSVDAGAGHGDRDRRVSRGLLAASLAENGELWVQGIEVESDRPGHLHGPLICAHVDLCRHIYAHTLPHEHTKK